MPRPHPPEFRQRAVELAQLREQPLGKIAADLGISESCLRRWVGLAEGGTVRAGGRTGPDAATVLDGGERAELIELRRKTRVQAMEIEILRRASAYFAREALPDPK
ncbi:transposase-like protein [Kineococcus xinjiangensis]|uniref:Transposase-like protein n=1 Tax=Kineococcus xinjiangensis TaxID=512762 RepID=A0A2S6ICH0_9ACTN|nr:transposase [Kineococcus xinjiangensis]PPK91887.1 transposase-like protein [Kineococcus xinjiangensis]